VKALLPLLSFFLISPVLALEVLGVVGSVVPAKPYYETLLAKSGDGMSQALSRGDVKRSKRWVGEFSYDSGLEQGSFQPFQLTQKQTERIIQPLCLVSNDQRSIDWLIKSRSVLTEVNAVCYLVKSTGEGELKELRDHVSELRFFALDPTLLITQFGVPHYPALISKRGRTVNEFNNLLRPIAEVRGVVVSLMLIGVTYTLKEAMLFLPELGVALCVFFAVSSIYYAIKAFRLYVYHRSLSSSAPYSLASHKVFKSESVYFMGNDRKNTVFLYASKFEKKFKAWLLVHKRNLIIAHLFVFFNSYYILNPFRTTFSTPFLHVTKQAQPRFTPLERGKAKKAS